MSEIKGYLLTEEEEKECVALVKKLRERKVFTIDFSGCVRIKAKNDGEAYDLFWDWVGDLQNQTLADRSGVITQTPYFDYEGAEEE